MSTLHRIRFAYLQLRHRVRMRLIRIARRRHRAFLQLPLAPESRWPTVNDNNNSVGRCRRENGLR